MINIAHLETDLTTACQLSCVGCNHLVVPYRELGKVWKSDPEQVKSDLYHLSKVLHADVWGALGGEPTLHPQLLQILKIVRESGICDKIEVWTNGISAQRLNERFWSNSLLDVLVLSRYEGKLTDGQVNWISDKCQNNNIQLIIKDERTWHNFRNNLEPVPTNEHDTKIKFDRCFFRQFSRVVNNGYFYTCCCAPHMPSLLQGRKMGSDGIKVDGITENGLIEYLTRSEPLGCCNICAGRDTAKTIDWKEEKNLDVWLEKSAGLNSFV